MTNFEAGLDVLAMTEERKRRFEEILATMDAEGDRRAWTDETTGYGCLVLRGPDGALNGYVRLSRSHPWIAMGSYECIDHLQVAGGVSYLGDSLRGEVGWFVGFATGFCVGAAYILRGVDTPASAHLAEVYFDMEFTKAEVEKLAAFAQEAFGC